MYWCAGVSVEVWGGIGVVGSLEFAEVLVCRC